MKKIFLLLVWYFFFLEQIFAVNKEDIIPYNSEQVLSSTAEGTSLLDYMLSYVRDTIFALLALAAIGIFLYIGWKLIAARGKPEELTKAIKSFIFAWVGIFIVVFAWAAVRFIAGINL